MTSITCNVHIHMLQNYKVNKKENIVFCGIIYIISWIQLKVESLQRKEATVERFTVLF